MNTRKSKFTVSWTEKLNAQVELQNTVTTKAQLVTGEQDIF